MKAQTLNQSEAEHLWSGMCPLLWVPLCGWAPNHALHLLSTQEKSVWAQKNAPSLSQIKRVHAHTNCFPPGELFLWKSNYRTHTYTCSAPVRSQVAHVHLNCNPNSRSSSAEWVLAHQPLSPWKAVTVHWLLGEQMHCKCFLKEVGEHVPS